MINSNFPRYQEFEPRIPVWCITPNEGRCIHRFFDTSPISPSGLYLAALRLPFEDRLNQPGEEAEVILVDLEAGTERAVARTRGWEMQMGANLNWGATDEELCFNDVDTGDWTARLVKLNPLTGASEQVRGGLYHLSPDGRYAAAATLEAMRRTQYGYGVVVPDEHVPRNIGAREDDGLWITDVQSGERRLVLSLADAVQFIPGLEGERLEDWEIYGFHTKWNPQGDRLIFTIRRFLAAGPRRFSLLQAGGHTGQPLHYDVLTLRPDGTDVYNAVPAARWVHRGHHINWYPDGRTLSMNLGGFGEGLRLVRVNHDGTDLRPIFPDILGSGHPTVHPTGPILTDTYTHESMSFEDGTVPLRWITPDGVETCLARIGARTEPQPDSTLRVDPHPAWDRTWRWVAFNGVRPGDNTRRVFIADMQPAINECRKG